MILEMEMREKEAHLRMTATPEYEAYLRAWGAVTATPQFQAWWDAHMKYKAAQKKEQEVVPCSSLAD